jgi:hypothetical protein
MRSDANNAIEAASAGARCQEKTNLPAKGKVFLLDIPFHRTRQVLNHVPLFSEQVIPRPLFPGAFRVTYSP